MAKKLVTIDVNDKDLTVSAKTVSSGEVVKSEATEMEKLGIMELNNSAVTKTSSKMTAKGFEKNLSNGKKRSVKSKTSEVEDYFDFSFRKNDKDAIVNDCETKKSEKTTTRTCKKSVKSEIVSEKKEAQETLIVKIDETMKQEQTENITSSMFDNEVYQIINVARIGSLFDCEKRAIQA